MYIFELHILSMLKYFVYSASIAEKDVVMVVEYCYKLL